MRRQMPKMRRLRLASLPAYPPNSAPLLLSLSPLLSSRQGGAARRLPDLLAAPADDEQASSTYYLSSR